MDRPDNPYSHNPYAEDEAYARARWSAMSAEEQTAFLVEIGILTPDLKLHPNYDHRPEGAGTQADAK